jgi:hypothetical protein
MTPIDTIRAALEQARELIPEYCGIRTQYDAALSSLAELETELAAAIEECNRLRSCMDDEIQERNQLRARLAAIDAAPTVATVIDIGDECGENLNVTFYSYQLPPVGTQLIVRPEAK